MSDTDESSSGQEYSGDEYINPFKAKKMLGVNTKTLYRWDREGKVETIRLPSGQRRYNLKDIKKFIVSDNSSSKEVDKRKKICYCRVSSNKQKDELERQKDFFKRRYPDHKIITDVGSGINWKRKGLNTILELSLQGDISEVVVAHKDQLCRFAFELVEAILRKKGVEIVVLDNPEKQSSSEELAEDLLSIVHIYSNGGMGKRRYGTKNKESKNLSNDQPEESIKGMDGN